MPLMYIDIPFTFHQVILQVDVYILWPFLSTIKEVVLVVEGRYVFLLCFVWIVASVFTTITTTYHTKFFTILFQIDENNFLI